MTVSFGGGTQSPEWSLFRLCFSLPSALCVLPRGQGWPGLTLWGCAGAPGPGLSPNGSQPSRPLPLAGAPETGRQYGAHKLMSVFLQTEDPQKAC